MYRTLAPGAIGVKVPFAEAVRLAAQYGFEGIDISIGDIRTLGLGHVRALLEQHHLKAAVTGLPVAIQADDATFEQALGQLSDFARSMAEVGCARVVTWFRSWHETLSYQAHFELLRSRAARICELLAPHGLRFGLEFIGPETFRAGKPNPFIHDIDGLLELIWAVGAPNLGFLLDAWHWYTSGGTPDDLDKLSDQLVIAVHVNDAPAGVPREEQVDQVRAMPGETGVIDIAAFMRALDRMGYTGPIIVEPFSQWVRNLAPEEAVAATAQALDKIWDMAGL